MNSGDTNLLLYAMNRGCAEHAAAKAWLEAALAEPEAKERGLPQAAG